MAAAKFGQFFFALSLAIIGILSLASADFAFVWQPVPAWVPFHAPLAYASGAMLLAGGIGVLLSRFALRASVLLTANMVLWLLALRIPPVLSDPTNESKWLGVGETTILVTGAWILYLMIRAGGGTPSRLAPANAGRLRILQLVYGLALLMVGLSHFVYWKFTAAMIPGWIPAHVPFAYLTGAGHLAAGLALVFGVAPRLAATMEAAMITIFTAIVGVAGVLGEPGSRMQWTAFCISAAMAGGAWVVAGALADRAWFSVGAQQPLPDSPPLPA